MKKLIPLICCLVLLSCKEEPIPVVSMQILPEELAHLGADTLFDTIPYQIVNITRDTVTLDSILVDTLRIDTFRLDTFYLDSVRLRGVVSYEGDKPYGPALQEYGFCLDDQVRYPVSQSEESRTPVNAYDTFAYVLQVRNTAEFYVYAYAINPFGTVRSATRKVSVAALDTCR